MKLLRVQNTNPLQPRQDDRIYLHESACSILSAIYNRCHTKWFYPPWTRPDLLPGLCSYKTGSSRRGDMIALRLKFICISSFCTDKICTYYLCLFIEYGVWFWLVQIASVSIVSPDETSLLSLAFTIPLEDIGISK